MEHLHADAQALAEGWGANRHHHEFLEIDIRIGMCAAVEDVQHGDRQQVTRRVARQVCDVRIEAFALPDGIGFERRHRNREDGVGAEPALIGAAIEPNHRLVEFALCQIPVLERTGDLAVHVGDGFGDASAQVALRITIP